MARRNYSAFAEILHVDGRCAKLTTGASTHTDYLYWLLKSPTGIVARWRLESIASGLAPVNTYCVDGPALGLWPSRFGQTAGGGRIV